VENCCHFDQGPYYYFFFTGDFDNGHWEYLAPKGYVELSDGSYKGRMKTVIGKNEISFDQW